MCRCQQGDLAVGESQSFEYDEAKEVRARIQFEDGARGLSSTIYGLLHCMKLSWELEVLKLLRK